MLAGWLVHLPQSSRSRVQIPGGPTRFHLKGLDLTFDYLVKRTPLVVGIDRMKKEKLPVEKTKDTLQEGVVVAIEQEFGPVHS